MEIERLSFAEDAWPRSDFLEIAREKENVFTVAEAEGQIAGYVIGITYERTGYIASLATHPDHRRRGLGRGLVGHILDALIEQKASVVTLHVSTTNEAAIRLYQSFGFRAVEEIAGYYADGTPGLLMLRPTRALD